MTELPILLLDNFFLFPKCENYLSLERFLYIILIYIGLQYLFKW